MRMDHSDDCRSHVVPPLQGAGLHKGEGPMLCGFPKELFFCPFGASHSNPGQRAGGHWGVHVYEPLRKRQFGIRTLSFEPRSSPETIEKERLIVLHPKV